MQDVIRDEIDEHSKDVDYDNPRYRKDVDYKSSMKRKDKTSSVFRSSVNKQRYIQLV